MVKKTTQPEGVIANVLKQVTEAATLLWNKGWAEGSAGNLSLDVTHLAAELTGANVQILPTPCTNPCPELNGAYFWLTAKGSRMRDVAREIDQHSGIVRIGDKGRTCEVVWGPPGFVPTSELPSHLAIHTLLRRSGRSDKAVVHTHPTELIALTHVRDLTSSEKLNHVLWAMIPEMVVFIPEGVGVAPYQIPGSQEQANVTLTALAKHRIVLWEKHGALAVGNDLLAAFDLIDMANKAAQIYLTCRNAGFQPEGLSGRHVAELRRAYPPR